MGDLPAHHLLEPCEPAVFGAAGVGGGLLISVRRRQRIGAVHFGDACLIRVESGRKTVSGHGRAERFDAGRYVIVNAGETLDLDNDPDRSGWYRASCLSFDAELIRGLPATIDTPPEPRAFAGLDAGHGLNAAFDHAVAGLRDPASCPPVLLRHRLGEVLLAVAAQGFWLRISRHPDIRERLRQCLAAAPAQRWTAQAAAQTLNMSEATLRRRLMETGSGFRAELDQVRMDLALALLQGSRLPIARIAEQCGYASSSKFSARFQRQHGVRPAALRD